MEQGEAQAQYLSIPYGQTHIIPVTHPDSMNKYSDCTDIVSTRMRQ